MNHDDFERRLGRYLEEGADRAPEQFVWQALDDVERTPQRPGWLTWTDELRGRLGAPARMVGIAAVLVLLLVGSYLVFSRGNVGHAEPTPRVYQPADLQRIVIWEDTKPADWTLDNLISNPGQVLEVVARTMDPTAFVDLPEMGQLIGGRYTDFSGPGGAYMSWGTLYSTSAHAEAAIPLIANELAAADGWGLGPGMETNLGNGGLRFTGETRVLVRGDPHDPVPTLLYLWRVDNMLLAVGGWFEFDPMEIRRLAEAMDARAGLAP